MKILFSLFLIKNNISANKSSCWRLEMSDFILLEQRVSVSLFAREFCICFELLSK